MNIKKALLIFSLCVTYSNVVLSVHSGKRKNKPDSLALSFKRSKCNLENYFMTIPTDMFAQQLLSVAGARGAVKVLGKLRITSKGMYALFEREFNSVVNHLENYFDMLPERLLFRSLSLVSGELGAIKMLQKLRTTSQKMKKKSDFGLQKIVDKISKKGDSEILDWFRGACLSGYPVMVKKFLQLCKLSRRDVNEIERLFQKNVLMFAAERGHAEVVKVLLASVLIDPNLHGQHGKTALMMAAEKGHTNVVKSLISSSKVNLNSKAVYYGNWTALLFASVYGHTEVVKLLLSTGKVDDKIKNYEGKTPLMLASERGYTEIVRLLAQYAKKDKLH